MTMTDLNKPANEYNGNQKVLLGTSMQTAQFSIGDGKSVTSGDQL